MEMETGGGDLLDGETANCTTQQSIQSSVIKPTIIMHPAVICEKEDELN